MTSTSPSLRVLLRAALRARVRSAVVGPKRRRPKPDRGGLADPLPIEPNRPNTLSGGAAAALEFDD